jgi:hypothetical protein
VLLILALMIALPMVANSSAAAQDVDAPFASPREPILPLRLFRNWLATHEQRSAEIDYPIQTDRPSFTASQALVPQGWAQLESGYQFTWNDSGNRVTNQNAEPQLNLRLGLTDWLEFRNLWAGFESIHERNTNTGIGGFTTTSANFQTGFKFRVSKPRGWIPQSALITTVFVPTGYGVASNDTAAPMVDYIYCWTYQEKLTFTGSTGAVFAEHNGRGHNEHYQSAVFGQEWSETWSTYVEWYITGNESFFRDTSGQNIDAGVLWRPWKNIQFDWRAGHGLSGTADDFFTGVGLSGRY